MPLDRTNGEPIDDRPRDPATLEVTGPGFFAGARYVVIEPADLFSLDIRVPYELPVAPGKFRSFSNPKMGRRHIFEDVGEIAGEHFIREGAFVGVRGLLIEEDDILVQVYPELLKVVVLVQRTIRGQEQVAQIVYPREGVWPPDLIRAILDGAGKKAPVRH